MRGIEEWSDRLPSSSTARQKQATVDLRSRLAAAVDAEPKRQEQNTMPEAKPVRRLMASMASSQSADLTSKSASTSLSRQETPGADRKGLASASGTSGSTPSRR